MVNTEEGRLELQDGSSLYTKTWKPDGPPTAIMIFLHGFSDHCNAYYDLFPTLASSPYLVQTHALDQRGWGRSVTTPASRGVTGATTLVLSDIHAFVQYVAALSSSSDLPILLMGHSMGGAQALHYLLTTQPFSPPQPKISGLLLESPFISLHPTSQPYRITVAAGSLASYLLPNMQLLQKLPATHLSRSTQVQQDWTDDELCHDTGTLSGLAGMLQRASDLTSLSQGYVVGSLKRELPCPLWVGHGTEDYVTWYDASKRLFEVLEVEVGDKTFKTYDKAYHKLHAEPDGVAEEFVKDVGEWIISKAKASESGVGRVSAKL